MVRCINEDIILQIIKDKNLLDKEQITNLKIIIEEAIIDNEIMIDILYENKILPLISNISYIKIYNYSCIQAYVVNDYFIYEDVQGNKITAINDLKILFNNNILKSIILIKKYYFYKLLEKNFADLTSIKAKYALGFKVGPIIAKNINYTNKVIIFFVVFIATLIYLPVLFHVANNISYCLQNILKSLLFIRAVRESSSVQTSFLYSSMSFLRKRNPATPIKNKFFIGLFYQKYAIFVLRLRLFFWIPAFAGMT